MEINTIKMESKTYQYRKVTKPLLERKRRARINKCLDNLKDLMIECMQQQGDNIARLEKADILELTVEHLRKIKQHQQQKSDGQSSINNNNNIDSFKSGYVHAANEVSRALATLPRVDIKLGTKLMTHLGHRLNQIQDQQHEIIIPKTKVNTSLSSSSSSSSSLVSVASPLSVYCDNDNYYNSATLYSPSNSSGYGSDDNEFSSTTTSNHLLQMKNIWRPW